MKKLVTFLLNSIGYQIHRLPKGIDKTSLTMEAALWRCVNRGLNINTVIDVGASNGQWSRLCQRFLPDSYYLLIEAQVDHKKDLDIIKNENINTDYVIAAAGRTEGKIYFDNSSLFGGLASEVPLANGYIEVPLTTIDIEVKKRSLQPPFLIKLDTHGFEVPILEGARSAIKSAELIIVETYNYRLTDDSLKFHQLCSYMENLGFASIELVDFVLRKYDNSFWQMDTFFIPLNREEFKYNSYK